MSPKMIPAPEPGIYPDIPMETYLAWDAASNSQLTRILKSPAHLLAYRQEQIDTAALKFGRASHTLLFEPEKFREQFCSEPDITGPEFASYASPRSTKAYKQQVAVLEADGLTVLKTEQMEDMEGMRAAILDHPKASTVITATGQAELSVVWDDPETGVRCKSRFDWHTPTYAGGAIVDLKTTTDASPWAFERAVFKFGYHRQGALYLRGARALDIPVAHFAIVAAEKTSPYGVILYRLNEDAVSLGNTQLDFALVRYAECQRTGEYPGYTTDVVDVGVPPWADAQVERDLEEVAA